MENYQDQGTIKMTLQNTHIPIRLGYTYNKGNMRIMINYQDLAKKLQTTNSFYSKSNVI